MAGRQLPDPCEHRLFAHGELEGQILGKGTRVGLDVLQERDERLGFRGEVEDAVHDRVVERLDPEPVARGEQPALVLIPDREGEHAAQMIDGIQIVPVVGGQDGLGIRVAPELPVRTQRLAQLDIIVDLAIIGQDRAVGRRHRLVAGRGQVQDRQALMAQPGRAVLRCPGSLVIRPAMRLQPVHQGQPRCQVRHRTARKVYDTADAAHG